MKLLRYIIAAGLLAGTAIAQQTVRVDNTTKAVAEPANFFDANAATTSKRGGVSLATSSEVSTGTDSTKAATPAAIKPSLDAKTDLAAYVAVAVSDSNRALTGLPTIDDMTLTAGQVALLIAQTTASQNGPWVVASGAWTRPSWYPAGGTIQAFNGARVFVLSGVNAGGSSWRITTTGTITIGTTATTWTLARATTGNTIPVSIDGNTYGENLQEWAQSVDDGFGAFNEALYQRPTFFDFNPRIASRAPRQGLDFSGASAAPVSLPAPGTADFSYHFVFSLRNTPGVGLENCLTGGFSGSFVVGTQAQSIAIYLNGAPTPTLLSTTHLIAGRVYSITYVRAAGVGYLYLDGVLDKTATDTNNYSTGITQIGGLVGALYVNGTIYQILPYNYALTSAQVTRLCAVGSPEVIDRGGSMTAITQSAWTQFGVSSSFTSANGTAWEATSTSDFYAINNDTFFIHKGQSVLVTGTMYGFAPTYLRVFMEGGPGHGEVFVPVGAFSIVLSNDGLTGIGKITFRSAAGVTAGGISNFKAIVLGTVAQYDPQQRGIGYQMHDVNGTAPAADILLPSTGIEWALQATTGTATVRGRLSWSGSHEAKSLLGQIALSPNSVIRSITIKASASSSGSGITIGTTNSATRYVAATTYTTGKKALNPANTLPAASAAGDLDLVIDPDTSNYTGTIDVSVTYDLTTGNP